MRMEPVKRWDSNAKLSWSRKPSLCSDAISELNIQPPPLTKASSAFSSVFADASDQISVGSSAYRLASGSVFVDAEQMKAKLRASMVKPEYDISDLYHSAGWCQMIARSWAFERATLFIIAVNALWIAVDTDFNKAPVLIQAHPAFQIAEHTFCIYFSWEWTIRFFAFRKKGDTLKDPWFMFDTLMVFLMVAETWIVSAVVLALDGAGSGGISSNTGTLRLLRLLRLSRMARMAKLLRSFPELLILIKGMASATRSVFVTLFLLFILIYVFSIAFRQLTEGSAVGERYFNDMGMAIHTLWIEGTLLDNPGALVVHLAHESILLVLLFYLFVLLAALTVMNMLIGVLCEVVSAVAATEREQITMATVKDGFLDIIRRGGIDTNGDNMISRSEFREILNSPDAVKLLTKVGVDVYAFVDLADFLFQAEDGHEEQPMTFLEFMECVLSLRGTNMATVKDIVDLRKFIKTQFNYLESRAEGRKTTLRHELEDVCRESANHGRESLIRSSTSNIGPLDFSPMAMERDQPTPGSLRHSSVVGQKSKSELWLEAAELQGILSVAQTRLERFLGALSSPPQTASSTTAPSSCCQRFCSDSTKASDSLLEPTATEVRAEKYLAEGGSTDSLPGMVHPSGMVRQPSGKADNTPSSRAQQPGPAQSPPCPLPLRLKELRAHMQQLGQQMGAALGQLRSIQDVL